MGHRASLEVGNQLVHLGGGTSLLAGPTHHYSVVLHGVGPTSPCRVTEQHHNLDKNQNSVVLSDWGEVVSTGLPNGAINVADGSPA